MKSLVQRGRDIRDAIYKAWSEAGKPEVFKIKILRKGKKGFLWFGGEDSVVSIEYDIKESRKRPQMKDTSVMLERKRTRSEVTSQSREERQQSRRKGETRAQREAKRGTQRSSRGQEVQQRGERRQEKGSRQTRPDRRSSGGQQERRVSDRRRQEPAVPKLSALEEFVESWASEFLQAIGAADVPFMVEAGENGAVELVLKWSPFGNSKQGEVESALSEILRATAEKALGEEAAEKVSVRISG